MRKNFKYAPCSEFPYQYRYEHMAVTTDCVIFTFRASFKFQSRSDFRCVLMPLVTTTA